MEEHKSFVTSMWIHHPKIKFSCLLPPQYPAQAKPYEQLLEEFMNMSKPLSVAFVQPKLKHL